MEQRRNDDIIRRRGSAHFVFMHADPSDSGCEKGKRMGKGFPLNQEGNSSTARPSSTDLEERKDSAGTGLINRYILRLDTI
ncbi:hypothetical protein DdX_08086 [Ditylenchus destructor]|uniref:Uncharacterized protein n=1 Tax=Ditylenchus destructor TaxID=166010 RepID=A0AAD4N939_9BILA|nr:hypothetical protein DdX_08086 [Ditylenchus destructor]